ncbi:MAG: hypothetical protein IMY84_05410 [Chloroflexi bacterium]|nr:hypothetical protein [Chloroflexota bacterium]
MTYNWGPTFIVPSETLRNFSGRIQLRENLDRELLKKDLESLGLEGPVVRIVNPWYVRRTGRTTWMKVGESDDESANFPVTWDTATAENGTYEILGLMHVFVRDGNQERVVARESTVEVVVQN